jgi:hypothetical protein
MDRTLRKKSLGNTKANNLAGLGDVATCPTQRAHPTGRKIDASRRREFDLDCADAFELRLPLSEDLRDSYWSLSFVATISTLSAILPRTAEGM